ncbi:HAD hydrolase family protein [Salipaludibacillus sp. HK11]|uniref:HAD hydrolase family protein n=1 Tax=Salipaludibacillus sp. HK11 TaxID=3394320 RepID=UPI0039FC25BB
MLNSQGKIPPRHIEAVKKAEETGVIIVIATGRYVMQRKWITDELDLKVFSFRMMVQ